MSQAATGLEFRLLGPLEVRRAGVTVDLGPPKQRAVLAALLVQEGRVVSADRLIDSVWDDEAPPRALASVQAYISRLRALLGSSDSSGIIRRSPGYVLTADWVDVTEFRLLAARCVEAVASSAWSDAVEVASAAVALWRGPFLDDLADEPWVGIEAARLDEEYAQCIEAWVTGLLGTNTIGEAITRSQTMIEAHPLREHGWWLRMVALHRAGRSSEALDAFHRFAGDLDEQLGLEPGPQLRSLQTAILRHDEAFAVWPNQPAEQQQELSAVAAQTGQTREPIGSTAPAQPPISTFNAPRTPAIVGRGDQLAALDQVVHDVVAGSYRWVLLSGRAGIGKTRLANEACAQARQRGVKVIWTSCPDDAGVPAWWPLRALVTALGSDPDELFLPPDGVDADTVRFVVYERFSRLLQAAATEQPLLVVIDDAQWLDPASVRGLGVLAHTQQLARVGVILTVRDRETSSVLEEVLATLGREEFVLHLPIGPLDGLSATQLLREVAGDTVTAAEAFTLMQRIGGNPLLLTEYARLPADDRGDGQIPLAARGLLERRLHRLPEGVLRTLGAAAVIGDTFELDLLAEVTGLELMEVVDRLDAAVAETIIDPAGSGTAYQFRHGLLRDAVLARLTVLRRQALHARAAETLSSRTRDSRTLIRRVQHLSAAMPIVGAAAVVQAASESARAAEDVWDWDAAAQQWEVALRALHATPEVDATGRDEMLIAQLAVLTRAGRRQTVLDAVAAALDSAAAVGQTTTIGRLSGVLLRTAGAWPWPANATDTAALLGRLDELVTSIQHDPVAHTRVLAALAVGNCYHLDRTIPDSQSRRALDLAERLGDPDALADALVARVLTYIGVASHADEAIDLLGRLEELPHELRATDEVLRHNLLSMAHFSRGNMDASDSHLEAGIVGSDRLRLPMTRAQLRWSEARAAEWRGDLDRAERLAAKAYELHRQTELYRADMVFETAILSLRWQRGRLAEAPIGGHVREPLVWRALACAEIGDRDGGRRAIAQRLAPAEPEYWLTLGHWTWLGNAVADLQLTEYAPAVLQLLTPNRSRIASLGQSVSIGPVSLTMGKLKALLGDVAGARDDLALAQRLADEGAGAPARLRTRLALLKLDPTSPDRSTALRAVAAEAATIGMNAVAETATQAAST